MKTRFRLYRRNKGGRYYIHDETTGKQESLHTSDRPAALRLLHAKNELVPMKGRARLCPYYFVSGDGDNLRSELGGVLATAVPAEKKIVHGMADAILAPCSV